MRFANPVSRLALAFLLLAAVQRANSAEPPESADSFELGALPSFEQMTETGLRHNPHVRAAQAELDRVRLEVVNEIRAFRDQWRAQLAELDAAEIAVQEAGRLRSLLPQGAVAGKKVLEAEYAEKASRNQAALTKAKLQDMKAMLPLMLGAENAWLGDNSGNSAEHSAHAEHDAHVEHRRAKPEEIEKLLRQRLQLLEEIAELQRAAYQQGETDFDAVSYAQSELLAARLELAETPDERRDILGQMHKVAREMEKLTTELFHAQQATRVDVLKAKAATLRVEAEIQRK